MQEENNLHPFLWQDLCRVDLGLVVDHDPVAAVRWNEGNTRTTKGLDEDMCFKMTGQRCQQFLCINQYKKKTTYTPSSGRTSAGWTSASWWTTTRWLQYGGTEETQEQQKG